MSETVASILSALGYFLSAVGFGAFGYAIARFWVEAYPKSNWQLQIAMMLGLFGMFVGVADFASPGSAGAFALGASAPFLLPLLMAKKPAAPKKEPEVKMPEAAVMDEPPAASDDFATKEEALIDEDAQKGYDPDATMVSPSSRK